MMWSTSCTSMAAAQPPWVLLPSPLTGPIVLCLVFVLGASLTHCGSCFQRHRPSPSLRLCMAQRPQAGLFPTSH